MKSYCRGHNLLKTSIFGIFSVLFSVILPDLGYSQNHSSEAYTYFMLPCELQKSIVYLTSDESAGRATGSDGCTMAAKYIAGKLSDAGLEPFGLSYFQSFTATNGKRGTNVIGKLSSTTGSNKYIIIGAHYDHRGTINGQIYRGADDNASGVAVLLSLASAISKMKMDGMQIDKNILFMAFDGKELSMSGSRFFVGKTMIPPGNIQLMVNIDQIGTSLAAPNKNKDYIIAIGNEHLGEWESKQLDFCNRAYKLSLDIDYS